MNSFALALLLGGLRGPLVMVLWPSAEQQKADRDLEDFDTKIEWIRLLQAEFDTVHIFQIWNKAYNISVQMANIGNKYRTIIDALDYAQKVDAERPGNINIIAAIAQLYFDKLGNSQEKTYYRERIREETQARQEMTRVTLPASQRAELLKLASTAGLSPRRVRFSSVSADDSIAATLPKRIAESIKSGLSGSGITWADRPAQAVNRSDPGWQRTSLDPMLDAAGNILPEYLKAVRARPVDLDPKREWLDGSELQFLPKYQPFPYGLSTMALAYNYYKRAQILQSEYHQKHAQLSDSVIDSRPGLTLKNWSEDEWDRGRRAELEAFGRSVPTERIEMESPTADVAVDAAITYPALIAEALYSYTTAARLASDAIVEYQRHLEADKLNITIYLSHIDELKAASELELGDRDYLAAMIDPAKRSDSRSSAVAHYQLAQRRYRQILLRYYVTDDFRQQVYPPGMTRAQFEQTEFSDEQLGKMIERFRQLVPANSAQYQHGDEYHEMSSYLARIAARLRHLGVQ